MGNNLRTLFDYQRYEKNSRLQALIDDTESRYSGGTELNDDDLADVAAARNVAKDAKKKGV